MHLHVHTEYSLLDGAIRTKDLASKVAGWSEAEPNNKAVAMTDHGVMYGIVEFYENCLAQGVRPILGCETYVDPDGHNSRVKKGKNNHLILLAENETGYHNLVKMISIANTEGFYYKPRIDHDILAKYSKGVIASSACLAGEIAQFILNGQEDKARECALLYQDIMGKGNFYLEIMSNTLPEQAIVNKALIKMSKETGIPLIATADSHYLNKEDFEWHKILLRINTHADDTDDAFGFSVNDFYLKSPEEMNALFADEVPEALDNTVEIAQRCNVELLKKDKKYMLPDIELSEGMTPDSYLEEQARAGLKMRLGTDNPPEEYAKRLEYELDVIVKMGFSAYFLIVSGIIKAAKERHIPIGPGRGSAAGSLVAWSLKITELDPLKYNLLFERFLNPERISMPDIDTDVSDKGREQLLKYITERYGSDRVSQIITFGRMKSRQAVKDVGRATGIEYALMDKTAKLIPADAKSIKEALERTPELKELYDNNQTIKNILITAEHIEGLARHASQHAAGVVITPVPITDLAPIRKIKDSGSSDNNDVAQTVTQYTMDAVEKVGLVKMDFLGLSTLSILEEALDNIRLNNKPVPDLNKISFEDPATYKILKEADTLGVFQLESDGIRSMLRKLKIDCFEDLIAALAMYRPGPLNTGMVDQYIKCKHGEAEPEYPHIMLEKVLKETYGVILYQEQVMQCASILAGYTLGEADLLRRAMGKKKLEVMQKQRSKFLEGAAKNNIDEKKAGEIFDNIEKFAQYGFNKSHSAAYAVVTYDTAYLKANYKSEFMAAYLSSQMKSKKEVLGHYVREVRKSGLDVLPPDINSSMESFTAVGSVIRFGLGAVSRMGHGAVEAIVKARESGGKFKSLWDFVQRIDISELNRASIENLIKAGAFDEILNNRARLINALPGHIAAAQALNNASKEQLSLFGEAEAEVISEPEVPEIADYDDHTRLDYEKEVTGLYISGHPFDMYENKIFKFANCKINDLSAWREDSGIKAKIGGILLSVSEKTTKKGDAMGIMLLEDSESSIGLVAFPRTWTEIKDKAAAGTPCIVTGKLDDREQFIVEELKLLSELDENEPSFIKLDINAENLNAREFAKNLNDCRSRNYNSNGANLILTIHENNKSYCVYLNKLKFEAKDIESIEAALNVG